MSLPLQSLVYKTLGIGQGKVFAVELPNVDDLSVSERIKEYCVQLERPCLVLDGNSVDKNELLSKLQTLFQVTSKKEGFRASTYRAITKLISNHRTGVLCINGAQSMSHETEQLLAQLVHYARKHKLAWKFYFLSKRSEEATLLNSSFGVQKRLMWNERQQDWFFVEKAGHDDVASKRRLPLFKSAAIVGALSLAAYLFIDSQPEQRVPLALQTSTNSEVENYDVDEQPDYVPLARDVLIQRDAEFNEAMAILESKVAIEADLSVNVDDSVTQSKNSSLSNEIKQAIEEGNLETYKSLLAKQPDTVSGVNERGESVLLMAVIAKQEDIVMQTLKNDVDVNHQDQHGRTALYYASISGQVEIVKALLNTKADINLESKLQKTPLMGAVNNRHQGVAKLLINRGAKTDLQDHSGWTAMFYAVWNSRLDLVDLLLESGANTNILDESGNSLKQVALMRGSEEFQAALNARL